MRRRAVAWLVVNVVVLGLLCFKARHGLHVETDILKLLPKTEQNPLAEQAIHTFSGTMGNRVVFLIGHLSPDRARESAALFARRLDESPLFSAVHGQIQTNDTHGFYTFYFPHRAALPADQAQALSTQTGVAKMLDDVTQMLYSPMASTLSPILHDDPLLLFPRWAMSRPAPPGKSELSEGFLQVADGPTTYVVVEARSAKSPFARNNQAPAIREIEKITAEVLRLNPGVTIMKTGVLFFAHAGAASAEGDVQVIGLGSTCGIVLLIMFAFHSVRRLFVGLLPIASGFLFALTAGVYCFPDLHLLTLGFGASLIGVCVDYSFHFFADCLGDKHTVDGPRVLRTILPGITLGMITSVLAYMGLFIAPFPGLRQMAVFSSVGLLGAFGSVVAWFPILLHQQPVTHTPRRLLSVGNELLASWRWLFAHKPAGMGLLLLSLYLAAGVLKLEPNDDVRQLQTPSPALVQEEHTIRSLLGNVDLSRFLLVEGDTPEDVLQEAERHAQTLESMTKEGSLEFYQGLFQWIPSLARQHASREQLLQSLVTQQAMYETHFDVLGYPPQTYAKLLKHVRSSDAGLTLDDWLADDISEPFRHLWIEGRDGRYASLILLGGVQDQDAFAALENDAKNVTFVNKIDDVSELFGRYRKLACWLSVGAYLLIGLLLCFRYGAVKGALVFFPPCIAAVLTLGLLGHLGQPMSLFNALALLLVLGIGIDFTIFFAEARSDKSKIMLAILLSSSTTVLSFGLLALSHTQALSSFGLTVLIGIALAMLFAPMASGTLRQDSRSA